MIVLGIEGTAWNLSASLVNEEAVLYEASSAYTPSSGGIHPREAAQHFASNITSVIRQVLSATNPILIDGIAFSQGPGLGPCLRIVGTAARMLSLRLNVPLIGVNHCIAHIEVERWKTDLKDPVTLYVSGANSQVLSYRHNRYRILGETLDIGIGNCIDKFARSAGLSHPGGPKVEQLASTSQSYLPMPYVVKGMDFSFSGLATAAQQMLSSAPVGDICFSLQETAFSMLVEVIERALSQTKKTDLLLAGGVGANKRLQEMLAIMCEERGAEFLPPQSAYLQDNGTMIAYTGLLMLSHGITTPLALSAANPSFRPDEVDVQWIDD
ncbi:MAG: bifunctional N(6)-L-threonylcarbamoyladenine synthase/serine/threonine protein kinase [Halobacteriota archaeon]